MRLFLIYGNLPLFINVFDDREYIVSSYLKREYIVPCHTGREYIVPFFIYTVSR